MSMMSQIAPTIRMRNFGDASGMTEEFFMISESTITFNQSLVESVTPREDDGKSMSMLLSLHDGSLVQRRFERTDTGIVESKVAG